jgi:16S rRNA (guanine966-N2)-methyltransferase
VVGGRHRGRRLQTPRGERTRPTSDRVREALFNLVGPVDDATVLDLFAGSGALGIEALSRGARRCVFVESDRVAVRVIKANLTNLGLTGAFVEPRDALHVLRDAGAAGRRFDLVLVDPPYGEWSALEIELARLLPSSVEPTGLVVVETEARVEPTLPFELVTSRRYGSTRLTLYTP